MCRASDPDHATADEEDDGQEEDDFVHESSRALLTRATSLAAEGMGSAVLRRHCRTIEKSRARRKESGSRLQAFRQKHSKVRACAPLCIPLCVHPPPPPLPPAPPVPPPPPPPAQLMKVYHALKKERLKDSQLELQSKWALVAHMRCGALD